MTSARLLPVALFFAVASCTQSASTPRLEREPLWEDTPPSPRRTQPSAVREDDDTTPGVRWSSWDEGTALARSRDKPILLYVYADWCPHCRELRPVFDDPELVRLSRDFVMVQQNSDGAPAWLATYEHLGRYVPRIFFLRPDGSLRDDLTSGHPRYPYFWGPEQLDALRTTMRRARAS